jgi:hypothetical protein
MAEEKKPVDLEALCAYLASDLEPEERRAFEEELSSSKVTEKELNALRKTLELVGRHRVPAVSSKEGYEDLRRRIALDSVRRVKQPARWVRQVAAAAAGLVLMVSAYVGWQVLWSPGVVTVVGPAGGPTPASDSRAIDVAGVIVHRYLPSTEGFISAEVTLAVDPSTETDPDTAKVLPLDTEEAIRFHDYATLNYEYLGEAPEYVAPSTVQVSWEQPY